jgi:hypothetical protein
MRIQISLNLMQASLSGTNKSCPKCTSSVVATERRRNGNSICSDCNYKGPTKEFMRVIAQVELKKSEPLHAAKDEPRAPYGYCPICNDMGKARERRPNGNDYCVKGHSYPSASALPSPLGGYCEECHNPSNEPENANGEYVNKHRHPKFCIPT